MKSEISAFPSANDCYQAGMSLRDWYAGMALQGLMANSHRGVVKAFSDHGDGADTAFAESAYAFADAMLKARGAA